MVIEAQTQKSFEDMLINSKSYKIILENFSVLVVEKIQFQKLSFLQTAYASLYGFTRLKNVLLM